MQADRQRNFVSDNHSGVCPEVWQAMEKANHNHMDAYGRDRYTTKVCDLFREVFETDCEVFLVFNGTAANALALSSMCRSYHGILTHRLSHVETDECGAPEFFSGGAKVVSIDGEQGKVLPESVKSVVQKRPDVHFPKVNALSITQATEVGTVYNQGQLIELSELAESMNLSIHMDGARFANAVVTLDCLPKDITWKAGVDVLSFGGTKNGMAIGEAVIVFNKDLAKEFDYRLKQAGQLSSKMRYLSAPWLGMLRDDVWLNNARRSNTAAQRLKAGLTSLGLDVLFPVEANSVFAKLEDRLIAGMMYRGWKFVHFVAAGGCRIMCSWDTTTEDVDAFVADMKELVNSDEDRTGEVEIMRH